MTEPPKKLYFKGFNALRFYAALSVIVQHISYSPHDWFGIPLLPVNLERFFLTGTDAVNLFFVLSGFLLPIYYSPSGTAPEKLVYAISIFGARSAYILCTSSTGVSSCCCCAPPTTQICYSY